MTAGARTTYARAQQYDQQFAVALTEALGATIMQDD